MSNPADHLNYRAYFLTNQPHNLCTHADPQEVLRVLCACGAPYRFATSTAGSEYSQFAFLFHSQVEAYVPRAFAALEAVLALPRNDLHVKGGGYGVYVNPDEALSFFNPYKLERLC